MTIKNLWSLTVGEAIVAEKIGDNKMLKNHQVFFPTNSQLKDIDLILYNLQTQKIKSIQVKESRTYNPQPREIKKHGVGHTSWLRIKKNKICNPKNKIDFFIFVFYRLDCDKKSATYGKITPKCLVVPIGKFRDLIKGKTLKAKDMYDFVFFISLDGKQIGDIDHNNQDLVDYTKFMDKFELLKF